MSKLQSFIDNYGSGKLASDIGVSKSTVSSWRNGRFLMSHRNARVIADMSAGILTVHDLRPDIFGEAPADDCRHDRRAGDQPEPQERAA